MSWMSMLVQTYDNNLDKAGEIIIDKAPLPMLSHMTLNSQLTVIIDEDGNFKGAEDVDKNNSTILFPISEQSGGRSSGVAAHYLCDFLSYVAGDYCCFVDDTKSDKESKKAVEKHTAYITQLRNWVDSEYSHPKVNAIYKYISKNTLMADLIREGKVKLDEKGKLSNDKINGQPYEKVMVRFRVEMLGFDDISNDCWQDKTLFECFSKYYNFARKAEKDICYISGEESGICENHPKGIVYEYNAKLLSASENTNLFTYKGRFVTADEACTVGYESSQKLHLALTWLAKNQSVIIGKSDRRTYICWNPKGKPIPNVFDDPFSFGDEITTADTQADFTRKLFSFINGYRKTLDDMDDIVMISLDPATKGRLSVTFYSELKASDFLNRIEYWGESCNWFFGVKNKDEKYVITTKVPKTRRIVEYAFGNENSKGFVELDDKILKEQIQRVYSVIINGENIPFDFVTALFKKATNPQAYDKYMNYQNVLSTACAITAKYHSHIYDESKRKNKEGVYNYMILDENNTDRSYLFGRLHAVQDYAEQKAMRVKYAKTGDSDSRATNAFRFRNSFVTHPMRTYTYVDNQLNSYYKQLGEYDRSKFNELTAAIFSLMKPEDNTVEALNRPLNEMFLIGYNLQLKYLNDTKFPTKNNNN